MTASTQAPVVWTPSAERVAAAELTRYLAALAERGLVEADGYDALWRWSVEQPGAFWASVWDHFGVTPVRRSAETLADARMPGARWFPGERLSYARTALDHPRDAVALVGRDESGVRVRLTYGERVRITLVNDTMMEHPIHLHGMWSDVEDEHGRFLVRKHTVTVPPGTKRSVRVTADALGRWAFHCHMLLHMEGGMMREVRVEE